MIELFILAIVVALVVFSLRPRKWVLDEPLIIQCAGQYHITLAPQLQHAQSFIENIAGRFASTFTLVGDTATMFFEVHPAEITRNRDNYLLAVALRGGLLYFQAIPPQPLLRDGDSQLKNLQKFSEAVLLYHPPAQLTNEQAGERLRRAIEDAARQAEIEVRVLQ